MACMQYSMHAAALQWQRYKEAWSCTLVRSTRIFQTVMLTCKDLLVPGYLPVLHRGIQTEATFSSSS